MAEGVCEHRGRGLQVRLRIVVECGEARQLVQDDGLTAIVLDALHRLGGDERPRDLVRDLGERFDLRPAIPLPIGAMLDVDDADDPVVGAERSNDRLVDGRIVPGEALIAREQDRLAALRHETGNAFTDFLAVALPGVGEPDGRTDRQLARVVGEHDGDAVGAEQLGEL